MVLFLERWSDVIIGSAVNMIDFHRDNQTLVHTETFDSYWWHQNKCLDNIAVEDFLTWIKSNFEMTFDCRSFNLYLKITLTYFWRCWELDYANVYPVICDVNFVKIVDCWLVCGWVFAPDIRGTASCTGQVIVKEFMQLIYLELRCIIEWAKKVPGWYTICVFLNFDTDNFENLLTDAQMPLILHDFCCHYWNVKCTMYCSCWCIF